MFSGDEMRLMCINLWNNITIKKSKNNYIKRAFVISKIIKNENIDIIFTQEMSYKMMKLLSKLLPLYKFVYGERTNGRNEEANCIIIKNGIRIIDSKIFSLSKTPNKPNSKFLLDFFPRVLNFVGVYFNNKEYLLFNTHLDNVFQINRKKQLSVIMSLMKEYKLKENNIILAGDFNMIFNDHLKKFSKALGLSNCSERLGTTYRYFKNRKPIDHVFLSDEINLKKVYKYMDNIGGVFPSDHYPIIVDI